MSNFWGIYAYTIISVPGLIIWAIVMCIKKEKHRIAMATILIAGSLFMFFSNFSFVKDLAQQETSTVTGVYVKYERRNVEPGARRVIFQTEDGTDDFLVSIFTKDCTKMKVGKTYKIEYFNNSKVIKTYELIE